MGTMEAILEVVAEATTEEEEATMEAVGAITEAVGAITEVGAKETTALLAGVMIRAAAAAAAIRGGWPSRPSSCRHLPSGVRCRP